MADAKISQLPVASTPLAGTELVPVVQGGATEQTTVEAILTGTVPSGTANGVLYLNASKVVTSGSALTFDGTRLLTVADGTFAQSTLNTSVVLTLETTNGSSVRTTQTQLATGGLVSNNDVGGNSATPYYAWQIVGSEQMRLNSTGLGIGTNNPAVKLDVTGLIRSTIGINIGASIDGTTGGFTRSGGDTYLDYAGTLRFRSGAASERVTLDSSGNLGLGVTPSGWASGWPAFQVGRAVMHTNTSDGRASFGNNYYVDGTNAIYIASAHATQLMQVSGEYRFFTAPSGTAGNAISFTQAMTLDASGRLIVGGTSPISDAGFTIANDGTAGATIKLAFSTIGTERASVSMNGASGEMRLTAGYSGYGGLMTFYANGSERARITSGGSLVVGTAALATAATDGFLYVPTCAGTPTGTPTTQTGTAPIVVDTTNNKLYFYSGGQWRDAGP